MKTIHLFLAVSLFCSIAAAKVLTATDGWDYCEDFRKVKGVICEGPEPISVKYNIAKGRISTGGYCDSEAPDTIYIYFHDKDSLLVQSTTEYSCEERHGSFLVLPEETVKDAKYMNIIVEYSSRRTRFVKCREPGKHLFRTYADSKFHAVTKNNITCEKPESYYKKGNKSFNEYDECGQQWYFNREEKRMHYIGEDQKNPDCPDLSERVFE